MLIVTTENIELLMHDLVFESTEFAFDTETTGLHAYKEDRAFCITIATANQSYYLNFLETPGASVVLPEYYARLVFCAIPKTHLAFAHNAKFDMHMLYKTFGVEVPCTVHCTYAQARVQQNNYQKYSLAECASRIGEAKLDTVDEYIKKHKLNVTIHDIFGIESKKPDYTKVPWELITEYACRDVEVTFKLGKHQVEAIRYASDTQRVNLPKPWAVLEQEREITKICFQMEKVGIKIDKAYCLNAHDHEERLIYKAKRDFFHLTGEELVDSAKFLTPIFAKFGDIAKKTLKGSDSIADWVLEDFKSPIAQILRDYRAASKKSNTYYKNFLRYADANDCIHPNMLQSGTATGRFSYSEPNLQNLNKEEDSTKEFLVRRAFVPRPGYIFVMIDFDQMEYRLMIDYAKEQGLIDAIKAGVDVHQATADLMGVSRKEAKTINFMLLYGGGAQKLATTLGVEIEEAWRLKNLYFEKLPAVTKWNNLVRQAASERLRVTNWLGRVCHFEDKSKAYRAPNHLIQGGCADIVKKVMVELSRFLEGKRSRMLVQIHDEILFEIHEKEIDIVPQIKSIMELDCPFGNLKLTCGVEYSTKSWADKIEGMPDARNSAQSKSHEGFEDDSTLPCF